MKAIKVFDNMIIREARRGVHRDADILEAELSLEPVFGTVIDAAVRARSMKFPIQIVKEKYRWLWDEVKDASNDVFIETITEMLNEVLPVLQSYNHELEHPAYREAIQEEVNGELTFWYKDEDVTAFNEARLRSGHAPVMVPQPSSFEESYKNLVIQYPVVEMSDTFESLINIGATAPFEVVTI